MYISPYFAPTDVVGGKRALQFVRHLPSFGWVPVVLASPPMNQKTNPDLLNFLPSSLVVDYGFKWILRGLTSKASKPSGGPRRKRKGIENPHLTPLDQYMWDIPGALASGARLIREHAPRAVLVNGDPWSGAVAGALLSRYFKLPLVLDFRDPWSVHPAKIPRRPAPVQRLIQSIERFVFQRASAVVLNCQACTAVYRRHYPDMADRFATIRNAFDREMLGQPAAAPPRGPFSIRYFGPPDRMANSETLLRAVRCLVERRELSPEDLEIVFYGIPTEDTESYLRFLPTVPIQNTLATLSEASLLVLDRAPVDRLQLPAKLYDYLATGRPILAISDQPELEGILEHTGAGICVPWDDVERTAKALEKLYDGFHPTPNAAAVGEYSAERAAQTLAGLLDQVAL